MQSVRIALFSLMVLGAAGCQFGGPAGSGGAPAVSSGQEPVTCARTCNSEYDACMDRFSGTGAGSGAGTRSDDPASNLGGPNDVCPDQLKTCLKRCN
jgi:hypothetical protein